MIFSAVILGLAGLSLSVARRTTRSTDQALVMAALVSRVDRTATVAFDSLPSLVGCDSVVSGTVRVTTCVQDSVITSRLHSLRVIVRTSIPGSVPDTITFQRGKERIPVPLR